MNNGLFTEANGNLTREQVSSIAKRGGQLNSNEKSAEEKLYLVMLKYNEESDISTICDRFSEYYGHDMKITDSALMCIGRKEMCENILEILTVDTDLTIDIRKSLVFVEGVSIINSISLYRFLDLCDHSYPDIQIKDLIDCYLIEDEDEVNEDEEPQATDTQATGMGNNCGTLLGGN